MSDFLDQHVGRYWQRVNIRVSNLDVIGDSVEDVNARLAALDKDIRLAIARLFPDHEQRLPQDGVIDAYGLPEQVEPLADRIAKFNRLSEEIGQGMSEARGRLNAEMAAHPKNGTLGYWQVDGIRHDAIVRASSAPEAIQKAIDDGVVGDWESPTAKFIGETMPDVV